MPFLRISTNVEIADQQKQQLLAEFSQLVAKQTGKPEQYVMLELTSGQAMLFAGTSEPLAYLECKSIGLSSVQVKNLAAVLSTAITSLLSISADRIYIEFSNCSAEYWGWNGSTFA